MKIVRFILVVALGCLAWFTASRPKQHSAIVDTKDYLMSEDHSLKWLSEDIENFLKQRPDGRWSKAENGFTEDVPKSWETLGVTMTFRDENGNFNMNIKDKKGLSLLITLKPGGAMWLHGNFGKGLPKLIYSEEDATTP